MSQKKKNLLQKRQALLKKIECYSGCIKGSLTKVSRGGKPTGACHLTYKDEKQKTHTKSIAKKDLKLVEKKINDMVKIRRVINQISRLNIDLLKEE